MAQPSDPVTQSETYDAFFYGTLLHPKILRKVIRSTGSHLRIAPAILKDYIRHRTTFADFPAMISAEVSHETFKTDPDAEHDWVRGSFVSGLTAADMTRIDIFESKMYARKAVEVTLLAEPVEMVQVNIETLIENLPGVIEKKVSAVTYVWDEPLSLLNAEPWSFEGFIQTKLSEQVLVLNKHISRL